MRKVERGEQLLGQLLTSAVRLGADVQSEQFTDSLFGLLDDRQL